MHGSTMTKCALAALILAVAIPVHAQSATSALTANCVGKGNKSTISAYVMLLRLRWDIYAKWKESGVWPADPDADKALEAHSTYWTTQLKAAHAIIAGSMNGDFWDNVALVVFEAASAEDAESIVKADPAVKAHVFQAQVRPFDVFWVTNKFNPDVRVCLDDKQAAAK